MKTRTEISDDTGKAAIVRDIERTATEAYGAGTFEEALHVLALQARVMVGAHQCAISYIPGGDFRVATHTHSFSKKYAKYNSYDVMPTGAGIWGVIVKNKVAVRMTHEELVCHPQWKNFSGLKDNRGLEHPPMRGWLAVPIIHHDGKFLGVLQVSDKCDNDFTQDDQDILTRLAQMILPTFELQYVNEQLQREVTERTQAEEALQSSEKRFRDLVEGSIQGIVIHRDFTPLFVNQALATMFGYQTPEDILRLETIESLAAPHERARWRQYKEARLRGEYAPTDFEYQAVRKDGTLIWVENKVRVVLWEGAPAIQSTAYDITVRKQTEAALQQAHDALETRVAERTADLQRLNEHLHTEITERQRAGAQVRQSHEQLRALSTRLLSIQEEERRRIAGEVHDELGQALTALKLDLAWLDRHLPGQSEPCHQKTATMMQLLDTTIHTVRRIAATLRPRILDDLGLVAALEWQVQEFRARTAIACALTIDMEESGLDAARSTAVFRILQEALTNAARHAHATTIDVSLRTEGETLHLEVRDNGSGISDKAMRNPQSLGLFGMRERLRPWGGALNIQGSQGQGTIITVELPLDETERVR